MAFWKENTVEPKRLFRFKVNFGKEGGMWWAKNVKIPTFTSTPVEHQYLDNVYKFPGKVRWQDVTLTMVDPSGPDSVQQVMRLLEQSGYKVNEPPAGDQTLATISKKKATDDAIETFEISIINAEGATIEIWVLNNPFIIDADLGTFSYDSDDLREISLTIAYDWATCQIKSQGREGVEDREYFGGSK
tara:strand:- start:523 stop:1086 length:564 start_codon:yes stop_codon:yes gene_type:complete